MVSNSQVLEKIKKLSLIETVEWLKFNDNNIKKCADSSYRTIIKKCETKYRNLKKSEHKSEFNRLKLQDFLKKDIQFPNVVSFSRALKAKDPVSCESSCSYVNVSYDLAEELHDVKCENEELKNEIVILKKSKVSKLTLNNLKSEVKQQDCRIKGLQLRLKNKTSELKRLRLRLARAEKKHQKFKDTVSAKEIENNEVKEVNDQLNLSINENDKEIRELRLERDYLYEMVNDDEQTVNFFDKDMGKYTYELRTCIYSLLGLNVPAGNISSVIKCVFKLIGKEVDKLPTRTTILNMNVERLVLSQKQLNERVTGESNLALYTDETSKFGTKYSGYHVSDTNGRMYVLGMREIVTKSATDTLSAFQQILGDIEDRTQEADQAAKRILANITATMSDRASTEKKFNSLLEELRLSILPDLNEHWDELSMPDQIAASSLLNFFCGLHGLVHFADCANKTAITVQKGLLEDQPIFDKSFQKPSESGASRLTRTVCKALARGADEKNGKYSEFNLYVKEFIKDNNMCALPLTPFKGNRFNILFESSAAVFFLRNKIRQFLQDNQSNNLLKSVLYDLNVIEYLAGVKALGLISRFVTGPLLVFIGR